MTIMTVYVPFLAFIYSRQVTAYEEMGLIELSGILCRSDRGECTRLESMHLCGKRGLCGIQLYKTNIYIQRTTCKAILTLILLWPNLWFHPTSTRDSFAAQTPFTGIESTKGLIPGIYKDLRRPSGLSIQYLHTVPNEALWQLATPTPLSSRWLE